MGVKETIQAKINKAKEQAQVQMLEQMLDSEYLNELVFSFELDDRLSSTVKVNVKNVNSGKAINFPVILRAEYSLGEIFKMIIPEYEKISAQQGGNNE